MSIENQDLHNKTLGSSSILRSHNETKIRKLQKHEFALKGSFVYCMTFELPDRLNLSHKLNREFHKTGYPWLNSFLRRIRELTIRKPERVSTARSLAVTKKSVKLLSDCLLIV